MENEVDLGDAHYAKIGRRMEEDRKRTAEQAKRDAQEYSERIRIQQAVSEAFCSERAVTEGAVKRVLEAERQASDERVAKVVVEALKADEKRQRAEMAKRVKQGLKDAVAAGALAGMLFFTVSQIVEDLSHDDA